MLNRGNGPKGERAREEQTEDLFQAEHPLQLSAGTIEVLVILAILVGLWLRFK